MFLTQKYVAGKNIYHIDKSLIEVMSSFQPYPVINYNSLTDKKLGVSDPSVLIIHVNDYFILLTLLNICADINNEQCSAREIW